MAEDFGVFHRDLSQGASEIGHTHQITLSTYLGGYKEIPTKIRWIEYMDR
jgi:hypothetical protein